MHNMISLWQHDFIVYGTAQHDIIDFCGTQRTSVWQPNRSSNSRSVDVLIGLILTGVKTQRPDWWSVNTTWYQTRMSYLGWIGLIWSGVKAQWPNWWSVKIAGIWPDLSHLGSLKYWFMHVIALSVESKCVFSICDIKDIYYLAISQIDSAIKWISLRCHSELIRLRMFLWWHLSNWL